MFEYFTLRARHDLTVRGVQKWPHKLVFAQFVALSKKVGWYDAQSSSWRSVFVPSLSVWQAVKKMIKNAEPFKEELSRLTATLSDMQLAQVMALHPWRSSLPMEHFFCYYRWDGESAPCFQIPQPQAQPVDQGLEIEQNNEQIDQEQMHEYE